MRGEGTEGHSSLFTGAIGLTPPTPLAFGVKFRSVLCVCDYSSNKVGIVFSHMVRAIILC